MDGVHPVQLAVETQHHDSMHYRYLHQYGRRQESSAQVYGDHLIEDSLSIFHHLSRLDSWAYLERAC